jgi:hypothetical protein
MGRADPAAVRIVVGSATAGGVYIPVVFVALDELRVRENLSGRRVERDLRRLRA